MNIHRILFITLFVLKFEASLAQECSYVFQESSQKPPLAHLWGTNRILEQLQSFKEKYPQQVHFQKSTEVDHFELFISTHQLDDKMRAEVEVDYIKLFSKNSLSFLVAKNSQHLYVRFQDKVIDLQDHFIEPFQVQQFRIPHRDRTDIAVNLTHEETQALLQYLLNISDSPLDVLGPFRYEGGIPQKGTLQKNHCQPGHNCVSWIATAPIGVGGFKLAEILGIPMQQPFLTNPDLFHQQVFASHRTILVTYWTPDPL